MKVVWTSSGDEIEFAPENHALCEYFINGLNNLSLACVHSDVNTDWPTQLLENLQHINQLLQDTKLALPFELGDPFDQQYLNRLHSQWVKLHLTYPKIIVFLNLKNANLIKKFRGINTMLHRTEKMFVQSYMGMQETHVFSMHNPFEDALSFSTANVQLYYHDLGRNIFNKWTNFDSVLGQEDTNDYDKLAADVHLNLNRPMIQSAPTNYAEWCKQQGLNTVPGRWVNLGNFVNLDDKLTDYRKIMARNNNTNIVLAV